MKTVSERENKMRLNISQRLAIAISAVMLILFNASFALAEDYTVTLGEDNTFNYFNYHNTYYDDAYGCLCREFYQYYYVVYDHDVQCSNTKYCQSASAGGTASILIGDSNYGSSDNPSFYWIMPIEGGLEASTGIEFTVQEAKDGKQDMEANVYLSLNGTVHVPNLYVGDPGYPVTNYADAYISISEEGNDRYIPGKTIYSIEPNSYYHTFDKDVKKSLNDDTCIYHGTCIYNYTYSSALPVTLKAGKKYVIQAICKKNFSMGWSGMDNWKDISYDFFPILYSKKEDTITIEEIKISFTPIIKGITAKRVSPGSTVLNAEDILLTTKAVKVCAEIEESENYQIEDCTWRFDESLTSENDKPKNQSKYSYSKDGSLFYCLNSLVKTMDFSPRLSVYGLA